ncbi:hypothetical protein P0E66_11125 [Enterococcus faecalis]|uniref:hypothetical protein n=1 Tax=Enterococcus faecalis TaxID=1351 RepID=UPI001A96D7F4|nr:hypothetical protein [Enterococcus faecalis]MBO1136473.1 hypothetical protein [Enterococcus faecalis]MDN3201678.1 hypothetical protein [Enterococcus faecalis]
MNSFLQIQKQNEQKGKRPGTENIKQGKLPKITEVKEEKERKKDYLFSLYPSDREKLNELAFQAGFVTAKGKPNASALLTEIIHQL